MIQNPYPWLYHHQKYTGRPNYNTKFQWNQLINFAVILLTDRQTNSTDYISSSNKVSRGNQGCAIYTWYSCGLTLISYGYGLFKIEVRDRCRVRYSVLAWCWSGGELEWICSAQWSAVVCVSMVLPYRRVGPGHCCYRIGPIRFLAGWRKRRPEPGLVWFFVRFSLVLLGLVV